MTTDTENSFNQAMGCYNQGKYEEALEQFSKLALEHFFENGDSDFSQIETSLEMALASFNKLHPKVYSEIKKDSSANLRELFFKAMRHVMDHSEVTDIPKLQKEIEREIPLGIPDERPFSCQENKVSYEELKVGTYTAAAISAQGPREAMEDAHLIALLNLSGKEIPIFAVFDGHGGVNCALYTKQRLPQILQEELAQVNLLDDAKIYNALRKTFTTIDKEWAKLPFQQSKLKDFSGTTAVVAIIFGDTVWAANVGDSRIILAGEQTIQLSEEAKAWIKKYATEIFIRGGEVKYGRVASSFGTLDMARSIGDINYPAVSPLPTIKKQNLKSLKKGEHYLILACDGLWDVVSPQMASEICKRSTSLFEIVQQLEKLAFERGSTDNVSVLAVKL